MKRLLFILVFISACHSVLAQEGDVVDTMEFTTNFIARIGAGQEYSVRIWEGGCYRQHLLKLHVKKLNGKYRASVGYGNGTRAGDTELVYKDIQLSQAQFDSLAALELDLIRKYKEISQAGGFFSTCTKMTEYQFMSGNSYKEFIEAGLCTDWVDRRVVLFKLGK